MTMKAEQTNTHIKPRAEAALTPKDYAELVDSFDTLDARDEAAYLVKCDPSNFEEPALDIDRDSSTKQA